MAEKEIIEAVREALSKAPERKFSESVELSINLKDVDLTNPKNRIGEELILPKGRGKDVRIGIFATPEMVAKAKNSIDLVIPSDEISKLTDNKRNTKDMVNGIEFFIAEAPLMAPIGKSLGVILGPRGKMPRPIPPGSDPAPIAANLRKTVKMRSKDRRTFHVPVGTREMSIEDIAENVDAILKRIISRLERGSMNIHSAYVKTTMGPAVRIKMR